MKAKDTVIKRKEYHPSIKLLLEEQAGISFKVGQEERDKEWNEWKDRAMVVAICNAMLKGRKEVVEWVTDNPDYIKSIDRWNAKLKEWGLK